MNQSTIIFGFLFAAFFIFITQKGELGIYWGFLVSSPQQPSSGPSATGSGGTATALSGPGNIVSQALPALIGG